MMRALLAAWLSLAACGAAVVAVDGYHNNETKDPDHYRWEGTRNGGDSPHGAGNKGLGGGLQTRRGPVAGEDLRGIGGFFIADPGTPARAGGPQYTYAAGN